MDGPGQDYEERTILRWQSPASEGSLYQRKGSIGDSSHHYSPSALSSSTGITLPEVHNTVTVSARLVPSPDLSRACL